VNFASSLNVFLLVFCEAQSLLFALFLDYSYYKVSIGNDYRLAASTDVYRKPL